MNGIRNAFAVGVLALFCTGGVAYAQQTSTSASEANNNSQYDTNSAKMSDQMFVKKAARSNLAEEKLGQLAEQNGQSQKVKDFGNKMTSDHSNSNEQLQSAASQDNINLPTQPNKMQKMTYEKLSKLSGSQFDRAYARDMVKDHERDVASFKKEIKDGKDANIRNYASSTLPTLEEHLKLARQMYDSVGGNGTNSSGSGSSH